MDYNNVIEELHRALAIINRIEGARSKIKIIISKNLYDFLCAENTRIVFHFIDGGKEVFGFPIVIDYQVEGMYWEVVESMARSTIEKNKEEFNC